MPGLTVERTWAVEDLTLSGRERRPDGPPRGTIIALHGGGYSAGYWDHPLDPPASLLEIGATLGYRVIALDRPGYGASKGLIGEAVRAARQADILCELIGTLREGSDTGAAVFLMGHSQGAVVTVHIAASPRSTGLVDGIEFSGLPLDFREELVDRGQLASTAYLPDTTAAFRRDLFFGPDGTFDPEILVAEEGLTRPIPAAEIIDAADCPTAIPVLAPLVTVPVQVTMAEFEASSHGGPEVLERCGALFSAAPRVALNWQVGTGHNISLHHVARAYHLRAVAFFDEVVVAAASG